MPARTETIPKLARLAKLIFAACGSVAVALASLVAAITLPGVLLTSTFLIPSSWAQQSTPSQTMPTVIPCTSAKGERQVCKADTTAGVALLRSTGESNCLLGNTWGYDSAGVWVSDGCGGEFALGGTKEASGASNFVGMFEAYGQLRTHLATFNDDLEVQDNATRVGMNFATRGQDQDVRRNGMGSKHRAE